MIEPASPLRAPSATKKLAASAVSFVAIAFLLFGVVGLLRSETVTGQLTAGVVLVGGGILLARLAWRLYRGTPGAWRLAEDRSPEEARAMSRELARTQWLAAAKFLAWLVPVYLLLALLLADHETAVAAAALVAMTCRGAGAAVVVDRAVPHRADRPGAAQRPAQRPARASHVRTGQPLVSLTQSMSPAK